MRLWDSASRRWLVLTNKRGRVEAGRFDRSREPADTASFVPLLEAEQAEEQRMHHDRQLTWPEHRLIKEGFMLENLGARAYGAKKRGGEYVYTFSRVGKDAVRVLGFHRFR